MAFTFFAAQGLQVGASLCEKDKIPFVQEMMQKASEKKVEILLPQDILGGDSPQAEKSEILYPEAIPEHLMGLDIGPRTIEDFREKIAQASTVLWNGPMGVFENPLFADGTREVALALTEVTEKRKAVTVVGGGDSASAINSFHLASQVTHVSTGGGASLEFFEGKKPPRNPSLYAERVIGNHKDKGAGWGGPARPPLPWGRIGHPSLMKSKGEFFHDTETLVHCRKLENVP